MSKEDFNPNSLDTTLATIISNQKNQGETVERAFKFFKESMEKQDKDHKELIKEMRHDTDARFLLINTEVKAHAAKLDEHQTFQDKLKGKVAVAGAVAGAVMYGVIEVAQAALSSGVGHK